MKNTYKIFIFIALAGLFFTSCEKDNLLEKKESIAIDAEQSFPVLKAPTIVKYDSVYTFDQFGNPITQKTIKIRNLTWTYAQEWFLDDMHNNGFVTDIYRPGDANGTTYGYYYNWQEISKFEDNAGGNGTWSDYFYEDANYLTNAIGFHLPKHSTQVGLNDGDFDKLASVLGSTSAIRAKLQLGYDQWWTPIGGFWNNNYAGMWIDVRNSYYAANIVSGCGVVAKWDGDDNDHYWLLFTNIEDLRANVRLVRNITSAQW